MGNTVVATRLRQAGVQVEVHSDHFPDTEKDEAWLSVVGKRRWVVISKDDAVRRRELERRALVKARVRAFFVTSAEFSGVQNAEIILKALSRIERMVKATKGPIIVLVHANGRLAKIL
jgi:hypothetical protein